MAFDADELKKRRQQRQERRKRQQDQARQLMFRLAGAAVVLALCGGLIFMVTRQPEQPPATDPIQTDPPQTTARPPASAQEDTALDATEPETVIRIAAAGDLNVTDNTVAGSIAGDYTETFLDVVPALAGADLTVLNFEGTLCGEPYGSQSFSAPQSMMTALRNAGVDLIQSANSRILYNGISGLGSTLQGIRAAGMEPLGAYSTNEEFRRSGGYTIVNVQGIRVAFVAFTKGMDSMALPTGSEDCVNLLYEDYATTYQDVDTERINRVLDAVRLEDPDITIALLHWGSEYNDQISATQKSIRKLMLAGGVDVILGTHSHYVQELDFSEENGTLVAYSLGDFLSDGELAGTTYSIILELEITRDNATGLTRITGFDYIPIYSLRGETGVRVVRLEEAIAAYEARMLDRVTEDVYEDMTYAMGRLQERLFPPDETDPTDPENTETTAGTTVPETTPPVTTEEPANPSGTTSTASPSGTTP